MKKNEENVQELWDTKEIIYTLWECQEEKRKKKGQGIFKAIMAENPKSGEMDIKIHEAQRTQSRLSLSTKMY